MATSNLDGTGALIEYTPTGGTLTTHTLAIKMLVSPNEGFRIRRKRRLYQAWKADGTARETFKIGSAVFEANFTIRMDDEPDEVEKMLRYGLEDDVTLTYKPDGSTGYPLKVVSVSGGEAGDVEARPDQDRYGYGEYEANFVGRRVDGSDLSGLL